MNNLTTTVLIPTYCRPQDLKVCLDALKQQDEPPHEVLVVVRDTDTETWNFLDRFESDPLNINRVKVTEAGVLAALSQGFNSATGDIIAITDDDAAPHRDWLARIKAYYLSDSTIGAVGGKDFVYKDKTHLVEGERQAVGRVQWFGRVIGNHHLGIGEAREVDVLKGVNSSYRSVALKDFYFDKRLRISGMNTHYELALGIHTKKAGWKLIYDPKIAVDHYPGKRFQMADRQQLNVAGITDAVYNQTLILMKCLSLQQQIIFMIWAILVGTRESRGLIQCLRFLPSEGVLSIQKCLATIKGRGYAFQNAYQAKTFQKEV